MKKEIPCDRCGEYDVSECGCTSYSTKETICIRCHNKMFQLWPGEMDTSRKHAERYHKRIEEVQ